MIPLKQVEGSSSIAAFAHDPVTGVLAVQFKGRGEVPGPVHHYRDVDAKTAEEFASATSMGSHFAKHIRGKFESEKIVDEQPADGVSAEA